jgi:hypothetical protein
MTRTIAVLIAVLALAVPAAAPAQSDVSSALAEERYYSSYGDAASARAPAAPATPADDAPWKALAIGSGALVLALLGAELVTLARLRRAT